MKAKLDDGTIIDLVKDCDCLIDHNCPHWLYINDYWKQKNDLILRKDNLLSSLAYVKEENARLIDKIYQMESRHIVEIIR